MPIPKIIHQTLADRRLLAPEVRDNIAGLRERNPDWEHRLYDDDDVASFIGEHFGPEILATYESIDPSYGAARADLFRYLLVYRCGGVYLDIKSSARSSLTGLTQGHEFVLAQWHNAPDGSHPGWGSGAWWLPGGAFQQWHVIAAPAHPFLAAVIDAVLRNLKAYHPYVSGVGAWATFRTTGPEAYSAAIAPLLTLHPHLRARTNHELGLDYSIYPHPFDHVLKGISGTSDYRRATRPLVTSSQSGMKWRALRHEWTRPLVNLHAGWKAGHGLHASRMLLGRVAGRVSSAIWRRAPRPAPARQRIDDR